MGRSTRRIRSFQRANKEHGGQANKQHQVAHQTKEQLAKDEDANYNNFNEQHYDKSIDVKKEVQEMWKGIREDTGMTEQQLCESLTKMADLVGHDLQSF